MNLSALATRYAKTPHKVCIAVPLLIMGILYWLSSIPGVRLPASPEVYALFYWISPTLQNVLHVPAYAALGWTMCWALRAWLNRASAIVLIAAGISTIYGIFDEWHQSFVPGRYASLTDLTLDVAGVALGIVFAVWTSRCAAQVNASRAIHVHQR